MLGWVITVYRQSDGGHSPATFDSEDDGPRLVRWQTREHGLRWLQELARDGKAVDLGGCGYPNKFTAQAEYIIPRVIDKPPEANDVWMLDDGDIVLPHWEGKTTIDKDAARQCRFDEWLLITAWDES